jgi:uncharacterized protein (UPF0276 family)
MEGLPFLGLGLSSNLQAGDLPNPYRVRWARPELVDFVEYSAPLEFERAKAEATLFEEMWKRRSEVPVLFHPVHLNLWGPQLESVAALRALDAHARAVGSPWVGNDVAWWHSAGQPFPGYLYLTPPFDSAGLEECVAHAVHVQSQLSVPLALENPAVIARRGPMHVLDFMGELHARTGRPLILDLGHLLGFQLASGHEATVGLDGFPLEQVIEIHIAGGVVTRRGERGIYVDDHPMPVREELFAMLSLVLPRCTGLRAITFEGDGHPEPIAIQTLERLRTLMAQVPKGHAVAAGGSTSPQAATLTMNGTSSWNLFDERFGATAATEDPEGTEAEIDFRLAVIAETLDRSFPLTRPMLAGARKSLLAFTASKRFRGCFEEGTSIEQAFRAHARERLRDQPDDTLASVMAFEAWAAGLRPLHNDRLVPGTAVGVFPIDLSELLFAARVVRRHLANRAHACGVFEATGLETLRQVAARAPRRPFAVAVQRVAGSFRFTPLSDAALREAQSPEPIDPQAMAELDSAGLLRPSLREST